MASVSFKTEEEWRVLRKSHVGASEVAALYGMSPWVTKWELYMQKTGKLTQDQKSWMTRGRHFEQAIASYAREVFEIDLRKVHRYLVDDKCPGAGASLDYEQIGTGELIPTDIKWVERNDGWDWVGDELTVIPDVYTFQIQQQIACANAGRGQLIAFVGGTPRRMVMPRSEAIITDMRAKIGAFWSDVKSERAPPNDFVKDADSIMWLARQQPLRSLELPAEYELLLADHVRFKAAEKEAGECATAIRAQLVKYVMDQGIGNDGKAVAKCKGFKASISQVDANPGKVIDETMIGTIIGARAGSLRVTISPQKE